MKYRFNTNVRKISGDIHTPVELYLKIRGKYPGSFLLESSDTRCAENRYSYICFHPLASFTANVKEIRTAYPDGSGTIFPVKGNNIIEKLNDFRCSFETQKNHYSFITEGLFGYTAYDAIPLFEEIEFDNACSDFPLIQYHVFRNILVYSHYYCELFIIEHLYGEDETDFENIVLEINCENVPHSRFNADDKESSNLTDEHFLTIIKNGIMHCHVGDVFQIVLSRNFRIGFEGDDFNVYRALRRINPSPYLFYFDYCSFRVFGSSPEAQLIIKNGKAVINPIAGTYMRNGNRSNDRSIASALQNDPKENAEHVMLVDLARNDLSRNGKNVRLDSYRQVEYYSHVVHLVSKVSAELEHDFNPVKVLADSFPAGTLSGAPKFRAMQIIDENEPDCRGLYGGAIGYMGFNGDIIHAIMIRSFLSSLNELTYQAGCGVVAASNPQNELQEVDNKLAALRKAIELAKNLENENTGY
ncbi:MAG: anthranilate synthase component I family protein [Bacteroidota bacterium]